MPDELPLPSTPEHGPIHARLFHYRSRISNVTNNFDRDLVSRFTRRHRIFTDLVTQPQLGYGPTGGLSVIGYFFSFY